MGFLSDLKSGFSSLVTGTDLSEDFKSESEYLELNTADSSAGKKVSVRLFVINEFSDVKQVLDGLRQGNTIALLNVAPLKNKNVLELKRLVSKIKKTAEAIEGDVAGLGSDYVVATPSFARIHRETNSATNLNNQRERISPVDSDEGSGLASLNPSKDDEGPVIMG